jgi:hypothetical protein
MKRGRRSMPGAKRLLTVLVGVGVVTAVARADVTSDQAAAILVFPKLVVDTSTPPKTARGRVDTLIRISNTSSQPITIKCFYVNANGHCSNSPATICYPNDRSSNPCGSAGICNPGWVEADFTVNITALQPVAWLASQGAVGCEETRGGLPCLPLGASGLPSPTSNGGSRVPPVAEDPFLGELKCIAVDRNDIPVERNDLKGEAEIIQSGPDAVDVLGYNAVGIPAIPGTNDRDNVLVLGGDPGRAEYSSCPSILILDHFFDGGEDPVSGDTVRTDLTLVPCTEDFALQQPVTTPVQFLVFNEFEQRFSTSRRVTCFDEIALSSIDTSSSPERSIFSAAVAGTLTGQTRIRGVANQDQNQGHALLGIAEEFRTGGGAAAFNLHFSGTRQQSDFIYLP